MVGTSSQYDLTNCSTLSADFYAAGTAATVGAFSWALDQTLDDICNVGTNLYRMNVRVDRSDQALGPAGNLLTTSSAPLNGASGADTVAGSASETVDNQITMPCSGSDGAGTQASMSITYTAVLSS